MLCALIMAGGKGTRVWPLSTEEKPKQFLKLIGEKTMIQATVDRIRPIIPLERIFICTNKRYVNLVKKQVPEIYERNIIVEPEVKNTAPSIALSSLIIKRHFKDANMIVLPADHIISDEEEFRDIVRLADEFISKENNAIVTLGMKATRAETEYGYIKKGGILDILDNRKIIKVDKFIEKPSTEEAKEYVSEGNYLWNGGIFIWNINCLIENIKRYLSNTYELLQSVETIKPEILTEFINERYVYVESVSIDYALLEKCENLYVIPSNMGWDDVGTWRSVEKYVKKEAVATNPNVKVIETKSHKQERNSKRVVVIGINDIMTVETDENIFIVNKNYMEKIKDFKNII